MQVVVSLEWRHVKSLVVPIPLEDYEGQLCSQACGVTVLVGTLKML